MQQAEYCFMVVEEATERSVELEVRAYDGQAKHHFQSVWQRLYGGLQNHHKICNRAAPEWAAWKPWDWCEERKPGYEGRLKYVAWCGDVPAGFVNVWKDFPSSYQPGRTMLYLEHIAAAPGNLPTELWNRRYKAVGPALLAYTILLSREEGYEGRLGLHVAEASVLAFYRRIDAKCQNTLLYPERTGVNGPTPRREHDLVKTYLETREDGAARWLEEYRRERT